MFNLPSEVQDKILSYFNPFIEYYKKEYKKSLLYIKNLNNNVKPEYYNFITLYEKYDPSYNYYNKYYLCDCAWTHRVDSTTPIFYINRTGYFIIFEGEYKDYLNALNNNTHFKMGGVVKTNINLRIKKHLKTKQHIEWSQKKEAKNHYNLVDFIPEDKEYPGLYIIYLSSLEDYADIFSELYFYRKSVYKSIKENHFILLGYSYTKY